MVFVFFFFKQKTAYEIGLGIPAEPLFRSSFGGKTSYDADNRPLLVMRSNLWASGYDVDGTDQTSLGQFSGRVQQTYKHSLPRFFVLEHGTIFIFALVRFPLTATKDFHYFKLKVALPYTDFAGN